MLDGSPTTDGGLQAVDCVVKAAVKEARNPDPHSPMLAPCNKLSSTQLENGQRKQGVSATLDCHGEQGTPLPPVISLPAAQPPSTVNIAETTLQPVPRGLHSCISSSSSCNTSSSATTARKQEHTTAASTPASHLAPLQHQQQQEQQTPSLAALSGQRGRNKSSTSAAPPSWMSTTMFVLTSPPETSDSASSPGFGTEKFSERPAETPEKEPSESPIFFVDRTPMSGSTVSFVSTPIVTDSNNKKADLSAPSSPSVARRLSYGVAPSPPPSFGTPITRAGLRRSPAWSASPCSPPYSASVSSPFSLALSPGGTPLKLDHYFTSSLHTRLGDYAEHADNEQTDTDNSFDQSRCTAATLLPMYGLPGDSLAPTNPNSNRPQHDETPAKNSATNRIRNHDLCSPDAFALSVSSSSSSPCDTPHARDGRQARSRANQRTVNREVYTPSHVRSRASSHKPPANATRSRQRTREGSERDACEYVSSTMETPPQKRAHSTPPHSREGEHEQDSDASAPTDVWLREMQKDYQTAMSVWTKRLSHLDVYAVYLILEGAERRLNQRPDCTEAAELKSAVLGGLLRAALEMAQIEKASLCADQLLQLHESMCELNLAVKKDSLCEMASLLMLFHTLLGENTRYQLSYNLLLSLGWLDHPQVALAVSTHDACVQNNCHKLADIAHTAMSVKVDSTMRHLHRAVLAVCRNRVLYQQMADASAGGSDVLLIEGAGGLTEALAFSTAADCSAFLRRLSTKMHGNQVVVSSVSRLTPARALAM